MTVKSLALHLYCPIPKTGNHKINILLASVSRSIDLWPKRGNRSKKSRSIISSTDLKLGSVTKGICLMIITIIMTNISIALIQIVPNAFQFSTYVTSINTSQKKKLMKQTKLMIKNWWKYALKRCVFSLISLKHTLSIHRA